jgi:DnaK suppressor protein
VVQRRGIRSPSFGVDNEEKRSESVPDPASGTPAGVARRGGSHARRHGRVETFPDPTDRATLEDNRNLLLRIRDRERKLVSKIDEAIGRIEDGSYGKCEECGGDIGIERLKARPVTTLCIDCKSLQETQERKLRLQ